MGGTTFKTIAEGETAEQAYQTLQRLEADTHGADPYSGTAASKDGFEMITDDVLSLDDADKVISRMLDEGDPRIDDKWGPSGCIKVRMKDRSLCFYFFGWAPT